VGHVGVAVVKVGDGCVALGAALRLCVVQGHRNGPHGVVRLRRVARDWQILLPELFLKHRICLRNDNPT